MLMVLVISQIVILGRVGVVWVVCRIWGYVNSCIVGVVKMLGDVSVGVVRLVVVVVGVLGNVCVSIGVLVVSSTVGSVLGCLVVIGRVRAVVIVNVVGGGFGKGLRYRRGIGS